METRQLELFVAVAEELNFTRAARRLFATQSTVSAGIRALEAELGTALFVRSTRRVELTPTAEVLLPEAREALEAIDRVRTTASDSSAGMRGRIRIGILTSVNMNYLASLLGTFHERYPLVDLSLSASPTGSSGLADDVRHGRLDVAFTGLPAADLSGLAAIPVAHADYVVVVRDDDPLAAKQTILLADVSERHHVATPRGFGDRVLLDRAFAAEGLSRVVATEVGDLAALPLFVAAGLGIAVFPPTEPVTAPGVTVRPLASPRLIWTMTAVTAPHRSRSPALRALRELLETRRPIAEDQRGQR